MIRAVAFVALASSALAQGPLKVLCTDEVAEAFRELQPQWEKRVGAEIVFEFASSNALESRIQGGETFDVAVLHRPAMESLTRSSKLDPAVRVEIGRILHGIGVREGRQKLRMVWPSELKRELLRAQRVAVSASGRTREVVQTAFQALGITDAMAGKTAWVNDAPALVAQGKADMVLAPAYEISRTPGVRFEEMMPKDLQQIQFIWGRAASGNARAMQLLHAMSIPRELAEKYELQYFEGEPARPLERR